jgi:hypothetical protein
LPLCVVNGLGDARKRHATPRGVTGACVRPFGRELRKSDLGVPTAGIGNIANGLNTFEGGKMSEEFETTNSEDCVSEEEAARMLGLPIMRFRSLVSSGRISPTVARTYPHAKKLGLPPEESPDNEECFLVEDLLQLKRELDEE